MVTDKLVLYNPSAEIPFCATLNDLIDILGKHGFKLTIGEDRSPIYHGTAWLSKIDKVAIHFYFESDKLNSFMMTSSKGYLGDALLDSYNRKQIWLESIYGKAQSVVENSYYGINDYVWELASCRIEHFIKDRFGDEEGIYFDCK